MIRPITSINFKAHKTTKRQQNITQNKPQHSYSAPLYKSLPVAVLLSLPTAGTMTSCIVDNRNTDDIGWLDVAFSRLSDEDIQKINETRQTPKNTVITKVDEYEKEYYTDSDGNRKSREVPTGRWHYELVNNKSGLVTGTTKLPEGYIIKKDIFGFATIVEQGTKSIFLKENKQEKEEIAKRSTEKNSINPIDALTGLLSDEQIEKINKSRVLPKGTLITQSEHGKYDLTFDITGLSTGTRLLPEGYEVRKDVLGFATIVPIDQKSIFLKDKQPQNTNINKTDIGFMEAAFQVLTDKQIEEINRTKKLPEGTVIQKDEHGDFYITGDVTNLSTGTRTLPKGFEVKKNVFGYAIIVPEGTRGIFIKE